MQVQQPEETQSVNNGLKKKKHTHKKMIKKGTKSKTRNGYDSDYITFRILFADPPRVPNKPIE